MPKISADQRAARRRQILEAARACFLKEGLHAATMQQIIEASDLSAGAVYLYFKSKDELIRAAVTESLSGLATLLQPLFSRDPLPPPDRFVGEVLALLAKFSSRDGYDLKRLALVGWAEAQRDKSVQRAMNGFYLGFRKQLAGCVEKWKTRGVLSRSANTESVAKTLLACIMGFVVESVVLTDLAPEAIADGLRHLRG